MLPNNALEPTSEWPRVLPLGSSRLHILLKPAISLSQPMLIAFGSWSMIFAYTLLLVSHLNVLTIVKLSLLAHQFLLKK